MISGKELKQLLDAVLDREDPVVDAHTFALIDAIKDDPKMVGYCDYVVDALSPRNAVICGIAWGFAIAELYHAKALAFAEKASDLRDRMGIVHPSDDPVH